MNKELLEIKEVIPVEYKGILVYRIFNINPTGYIIITADDNAEPIIGYGLDSNFSFDDAPPALLFLLEGYKKEMAGIIENQLKADGEIENKWEKYSSSEFSRLKSYTPGTFLLETTWGQKRGYNKYCPLDPNTGDTCVAGCSSVALAQILHYWGCLVFQDGANTYTPRNFTNSLTVNFYDQDYDWDAMDHTSADDDNAELIYHCGVAIEVSYTDSATGGWTDDARYAMENYFGFDTNGLEWKDENESEWVNMLKDDIDSGRPIYYRGEDSELEVGHAWVVDGYNASNQFHCNWGWYGQYIMSFYSLSSLSPGTSGVDYSDEQGAILGAEPILDACSGLDGSDYVCSSSNESYSVSIPSTASVVWTKSASLNPVGGNTSTTYTVSAASSHAAGYVTATIKNSHDQTFLVRSKDIGVDPPLWYDVEFSVYLGTNLVEPYGFSDWVLEPNTNYTLHLDYTNTYGCALTDIDFNLPGSFYIYTNPFYYISFRTPSTEDWYSFSVDITSECGTFSDFFYGYFIVGEMYFMTFSPNPSSEETIVTLENKNGDVDEDLEWDMEVYDMGQTLKAKKEKIKGNKHALNVSDWKTGVYIVRAKVGGKVVTGRLAVE